MIGMITAVVGGAFAAGLALLLGSVPMVAIAIGLAAFVVLAAAIWTAALRQFRAIEREIVVRFPSPPSEGSSR